MENKSPNKQSNLVVQQREIEKYQYASCTEEPTSQLKMHSNHVKKEENSLKKLVIEIKKLTNKEIEAHLYAGKYHAEAKQKKKKKHKKHKKDREKHKSSFKLKSHLSSEENVKARKSICSHEITSSSKKTTLSSDKNEKRSFSIEKKAEVSTSSKKVKIQSTMLKTSTPMKRKKKTKNSQHISFQEEELFYPPDRMIRINTKKFQCDEKSSVSEVKYPAKDATNEKKDPGTTPGRSMSCSTNQNKNGTGLVFNHQSQSLQSSSAQENLVTKSVVDATNEKKDPGTTPGRSMSCSTNQNKNGTEIVFNHQSQSLQSSSAQENLVTKSVVDPEIKVTRKTPLVSEESEDTSDDSSSLFSTDSSLPMDILEKLLVSSSESSPSEFEGF